MPSITRKACVKHGIYNTKSCEQCKKQTNKIYNDTSRNKESQKVYQSTQWRKLREEIIIRDLLRCVSCGRGVCIKPRDHVVDHIVEIDKGGSKWSKENLQLLCISCHNIKTKAKG